MLFADLISLLVETKKNSVESYLYRRLKAAQANACRPVCFNNSVTTSFPAGSMKISGLSLKHR